MTKEEQQSVELEWPNLSNCIKNCKKCRGKCFYSKEPYEEQKAQKPVERHKDTLLEWAKLVLKCQEEELAKYDSPSYMKASTMGKIDAYKVLIAKLKSL